MNGMTKSDLVEKIAKKFNQLPLKDIEFGVKIILDKMINTLVDGGRVEVRGFGSFCIHHRAPRTGRNPRTGEKVILPAKYVPHFKPGKELREQVNHSAGTAA
jgi:integration host factor subunit beta